MCNEIIPDDQNNREHSTGDRQKILSEREK